jgi:pseudaminic acid biosynthesis-associated methylase
VSGSDETARLESLWAGDFGDDYVDRNIGAAEGRESFWRSLIETHDVGSALEVGCNVGANLRWVAELLGPERAAGVDVNEKALSLLGKRVPGVDARLAAGRALPFADGSHDLVFTMGVLIHQPTDELRKVMAEIVRCSSRLVLCGEYYSAEDEEVPYRGERGALFKRDYGGLYLEWFRELRELDRGFLSKADGPWDDLTYWVLEKRG